MEPNKTIWAVAYINRDFIDRAQLELERYGHSDIEAYIPTVRLLKKKFKGKNIFEFVPLLFNYGFFKIPYHKAINPDYLMELRHHITCIYAWVKDPAKVNPQLTGLRGDNGNFQNAIPQVALATDKELARLIEASESMSIYNAEDLDRFKPGDYLKLQGYPFENIPAEIVSINHKKREVKVKIDISSITNEVTVSFDNVFYSVYKNFNETPKEESTDEMLSKWGPTSIDHLMYNKNYEDEQ